MAKILLVDDEEIDQALIREMLVTGGHEVVLAKNGQEAIALLEDKEVAAVVTDLRMPLVNGLRLIRALRGEGDTIPIIAISGANRDQLLLAQDYGANAGLTKPVDRDKLLDVLNKVLSETRDTWTNAWIHPEFGSVGER
jgi:CheY-like chemotaxis protein